MDTRNEHRTYVRPELVPIGRLEIETRGNGGPRFEADSMRPISF
jgi:hypothetical protein